MKRLYEPAAYEAASYDDCYWSGTAELPRCPALEGDARADVAIVGAGFTGLSAALHLAEAGRDVIVLDAQTPGFGASGRNGGFCCIGGGMLSDAAIASRFGAVGLADWQAAQSGAIALVRDLIDRHSIDAETHSNGETQLAHSRLGMARLRHAGGQIIERKELAAHGITGPFHGARITPEGFALNPRRYVAGLLEACLRAGVRVHGMTEVKGLPEPGALTTGRGTVRAGEVILATNGYSADGLFDWMGARFLPVMSAVMVTRPLSETELAAQGWSSRQMCYDTRNLLHYFRLLPENRMLFGMRGGIRATPREEAAVRRRLRHDFDGFFPAWTGVEATHMWSGLVCLMRGGLPFAGRVPGHERLWAGLGYHGNGVAMGSYTGRLLAEAITSASPIPPVLNAPPRRFRLGLRRRALLRPVYAGLGLVDRL
ncbi:NAD(P)/FAD-dependent oxidoreductase [Poseidonocella sedimentorum]|uniref:Glycine/D-amino acid oxidase n=1 Tax=Poseidonocella sedimentorum TaxID=871652 RepID=A0A1I6D8H6_9RHOB|nr:FAD-binding oxidoreductase [Poseidonocella sedimentorum]SFR01671.1 Glycine/D-amino acid oxidase [Poseidonocella sedimentorum]